MKGGKTKQKKPSGLPSGFPTMNRTLLTSAPQKPGAPALGCGCWEREEEAEREWHDEVRARCQQRKNPRSHDHALFFCLLANVGSLSFPALIALTGECQLAMMILGARKGTARGAARRQWQWRENGEEENEIDF